MICNGKDRIIVDQHSLAQPLAPSWDTKVATTHAKETTTIYRDRQCNTKDGQRRGIKDTSRPITSPRASQVLLCKGCCFEIRKSCFLGVWPSSAIQYSAPFVSDPCCSRIGRTDPRIPRIMRWREFAIHLQCLERCTC
jgi:hypothetical protein